jgi:hypothetical protein
VDGILGITHSKEEECKERGIISATNAVVDPRTMMITSFDAVITQLAVTRSWRSIDLARRTVLDTNTEEK